MFLPVVAFLHLVSGIQLCYWLAFGQQLRFLSWAAKRVWVTIWSCLEKNAYTLHEWEVLQPMDASVRPLLVLNVLRAACDNSFRQMHCGKHSSQSSFKCLPSFVYLHLGQQSGSNSLQGACIVDTGHVLWIWGTRQTVSSRILHLFMYLCIYWFIYFDLSNIAVVEILSYAFKFSLLLASFWVTCVPWGQ